MRGYRVLLANPTPHPRQMTIPMGRRLGSGHQVVTTQHEVTVELEPYSRLGVIYDSNGNRVLDRKTIDDIHIISQDVDTIDIDDRISSRVAINMQPSDLDGSKATRDGFLTRARESYNGLREDGEGHIGGFQLLAQLSYLRSQRDDQEVGLYSPQALNLRRDDGVDTIYNLINSGDISLTSCIGSGYNRSGALQMQVRNNTSREIRVRIPQGAMFEQAEWNGKQNLVVTNEDFVIIGPAQEESFPLHASCANGSAAAPSNDQMNVTPFIFSDLGGTFQSQDEVWRSFDGENRGSTRL